MYSDLWATAISVAKRHMIWVLQATITSRKIHKVSGWCFLRSQTLAVMFVLFGCKTISLQFAETSQFIKAVSSIHTITENKLGTTRKTCGRHSCLILSTHTICVYIYIIYIYICKSIELVGFKWTKQNIQQPASNHHIDDMKQWDKKTTLTISWPTRMCQNTQTML